LTVILENGKWHPHSSGLKICKINSHAFCIAARLIRDSSTGFDVYKLLMESVNKHPDPHKAFASLPDLVEPKLRAMLLDIKFWNLQSYLDICSQKPVCEIILAGNEDGQPKMFLLYFVASISGASMDLSFVRHMRTVNGI
jgi:hypothetical protein